LCYFSMSCKIGRRFDAAPGPLPFCPAARFAVRAWRKTRSRDCLCGIATILKTGFQTSDGTW
jgi:hypothetical protein